MRKQKLQFCILLLILVLVVFGYLYAQHVSKSYEEVDTSPSFELIEDATGEDTEDAAESTSEADTEQAIESASEADTDQTTESASDADTEDAAAAE